MVLSFTKVDSQGAWWLCQCSCGKQKEITGISLTTGHTKSCGCLHEHAIKKRAKKGRENHTANCQAAANSILEKGEKVCSRCKEIKPLSEFGKSSSTMCGFRSSCKPCRKVEHEGVKEETKIKAKAHRVLHLEDHKHRARWYKFGIGKEEYDRIMREQDYRCAICGTKEAGAGRDWHADHDHKCCPGKGAKTCGKCFRSFLCSKCNVTLGAVNDDVEILKKMISYLEHHRSKNEQPRYQIAA